MSRPRTDLSLALKDVKPYIEFLGGISFVSKVYLHGSRSPLSNRPAREDSDWDFICVVSTDSPIRMKAPRESHGIHADTIYIQPYQLEHYKKAVMLFPNDEYGVLKDA